MIFTDGEEIRYHDYLARFPRYDSEGNRLDKDFTYWTNHPGRYEGETGMARYLDSMPECADEETGETEWSYYVLRFGKRLLSTNSQGFVYCERFATESLAIEAFREIDKEYCEWAENEDA